jgi:hypothetical protein
MIWESCSSSYTKHNKIGFAIFGFFCDLIWILQDPARTLKGVRITFRDGPWKDLEVQKYVLNLRIDS